MTILHPMFWRRWRRDEFGVLEPDDDLLPWGIDWKPIWVSQSSNWTLVGWQILDSNSGEAISGEALYWGYECVDYVGGALDLYDPRAARTPQIRAFPEDETGKEQMIRTTVWNRVNHTQGGHGVPANIAIQLRSDANKRPI